MRLADLLARHSARLAGPADNEALLDFLEHAPMSAEGMQIRYRRRPDFFRLLAHRGDRAHVVVAEDGRGRIRGMATVSLRPAWMKGQLTTVGYLGDLRVSFDRGVRRRWRAVFADMVHEALRIEELADCTHWLTAILDGNGAARRALARRDPRAPVLAPVAPFTMRNLVCRWPWPRRRSSDRALVVRRACANDRDRLATFFETENRRLDFGFHGELERRLARWAGLRLEDFLYVEDAQGIAACVAPWCPAPVKQTMVAGVPTALRWLGRAAAMWPGRPIRVPEPGEPLRTPYLTHLTFAPRLGDAARLTAFRGLLDRIWEERTQADWHALALCDFAQWGLGRVLDDFVQQTVPITVYALQPAAAAGPSAPVAAPPAFEMAMA